MQGPHVHHLLPEIKSFCPTMNSLSIQWWSEIRPFEIQKHLKSGLFEGPISNGPVFKWSGFSYGYSLNPNQSKTGLFKIRTFLFRFRMFFTKWLPFVRISNGQASGLQIPFKVQTICNPTSLWPLEIQTSPDLRSPLYCYLLFSVLTKPHLMFVPDCISLTSHLRHSTFMEELVFWTVKYEFPEKLVCLLLKMLPDAEYKEAFTRSFVTHYSR